MTFRAWCPTHGPVGEWHDNREAAEDDKAAHAETCPKMARRRRRRRRGAGTDRTATR